MKPDTRLLMAHTPYPFEFSILLLEGPYSLPLTFYILPADTYACLLNKTFQQNGLTPEMQHL